MTPTRLALPRHRPWIVAHRGASSEYPENTLPAFRAAIEAGADAIELDVLLTSDRVPVVLHDDTLDRTTNGSGLVADQPWTKLQRLDAGRWFRQDFDGTPIPTLEVALAALADRTVTNVELKASAFESEPPPDALEAQVARMVREHRLERHVVVSSFQHRFLDRLRALAPRIRVALLYEELPPSDVVVAAVRRLEAAWVGCDADLLQPSQIADLAAAGVPVVPYTVNDAPVMLSFLAAGVRGLFTDEVTVLRALLEEQP